MEPPPTPSGRPPPPAGPGRPGTAALSLLQGASGLAFAAFAAAHFAGHLCVPFARSIADADAAVAMLRRFYQHPLLEPALVPLALSVHVGAGAALASRRWPADKIAPDGGPQPSARAIDAWSRERQRASGWLLALLVPFHAAGSRGVALALFDDPKRMGYVYPLSYMSRLPALLLPAFSSVFLLLAFPGAYHLSHGVRLALASLRARFPSMRALPQPNDIASTWTARVLAFGTAGALLTMLGWARGWFGLLDARTAEGVAYVSERLPLPF